MPADPMWPKGSRRCVLNTGSGPVENKRLHSSFSLAGWDEVRLDIDASVRPDLVGSIENLQGIVADASFDAVWSSHSLEHLYPHQVLPALREVRRILKPQGFAFITCPDMEVIGRLLVEKGLEGLAYMSLAGPISVADMIYGHRASMAAGNAYMAHHTGFTAETLGTLGVEAGFSEAHVGKEGFDLWAAFTLPGTQVGELAAMLSKTNESFLFPRRSGAPPADSGR